METILDQRISNGISGLQLENFSNIPAANDDANDNDIRKIGFME